MGPSVMMSENVFIRACNLKLEEFIESDFVVNREYQVFECQLICNYVRSKKDIVVFGRFETSNHSPNEEISHKEMYVSRHVLLFDMVK